MRGNIFPLLAGVFGLHNLYNYLDMESLIKTGGSVNNISYKKKAYSKQNGKRTKSLKSRANRRKAKKRIA